MKTRLFPALLFLTFFLLVSIVMAQPIPPNYRMCLPSPQVQNEEQIFVCPTDSLTVMADWRDFRF